MNIQTVKDFIEWSEGFPFVEVEDDVKWCIEGDEVKWKLMSCRDEIYYYDEWEYSSFILGNVLRKDGMVLVNTDNGCGDTITLVFLESMEVKD